MLENLRVHLHCYWQVIKRDLKAWTTSCQQCGALGAYPCSIAACIPLCNGCATEESIRLYKKLVYKECEQQILDNVNASTTLHRRLNEKIT